MVEAKTRRLVALHGYHGVGKDTFAEYLGREHGYERMAFADSLWEEVADSFQVGTDFMLDRNTKEIPTQSLAIMYAKAGYRHYMHQRGFDLFSPRTSRFHAQHYGNEYRLQKDKLLWVHKVEEKLRMSSADNVAISDLRAYQDDREYASLSRMAVETGRKMMVLQILRDGYSSSGHESDVPLTYYKISSTGVNHMDKPLSFTMGQLKALVDLWYGDSEN